MRLNVGPTRDGAGLMKTCKFCGQPIMEFSFAEGKQWWHMPPDFPDGPMDSNITRRHCTGRITEATPV